MSSRKEQKGSARVVREQMARERRRRRTLFLSVTAAVVLVIAGLIGWGLWSNQRTTSFNAPRGSNSGSTGIVVGSGPVTMDIYEDFICPICHQFEQTSGGTVDQLVANNKVRAVYHPVAYLNRASSTEYSTRSSAASGCAAQYGDFRSYAKALFQHQPPEGSAGLTNDQLVDIGAGVGLNQGTFAACVRDQVFKPWTDHVTEAASKAGVTGTPTVLVNNKVVGQPTPEAITAAVQAAGK